MSEAIKPTPGPWVMTEGKCIYINAQVDGKRRFILQRSTGEGYGINVEAEQVRADCRLIAEAGTVHHETGLTPRQLVERVKELEAVVKAALKTAQIEEQPFRNWHNQAVDALTKSLPNTVAETPSGQAPAAHGDALDAVFEAVRHRLCGMQRYSFVLDDDGVVRRVQDRTGNWIEFAEAHALFDPVAVDAAIDARRAALAQKEQSP